MPDFDYNIVTTEDEHKKVLEFLASCPQNDPMEPFINDVETTAIGPEFKANDPLTCELVSFGISAGEDRAWFYPLAHLKGDNFHFDRIVQSTEHELLLSFQPFFRQWLWGNHMSRYDWAVYKKRGVYVNYKFCSYVMAFLTGKFTNVFQGEQGGSDAGLKSIVEQIFGYKMQTFDQLALFPDGYHVERVDSETAAWYVCDDVNWARKCHRYLLPQVQNMFLWNVEMPLSPYVQRMTECGIPFIPEKAAEQVESLREFIPKAKEMVYAQVERTTGRRVEYDLDSPAQVRTMLFTDLKLPVGRRSKKTKEPSTNQKALATLEKDFDVVHNHLVYKKVVKADTGFLSTLPTYIHPITKRIHSTFHQGGVPSGRFASSDPANQNWSGLHEYVLRDGKSELKLEVNVKDCVEVEDDELIVLADYKAAEFVAALEMAGEDKLLQRIADGWDPHTATASLIFHMPLDQVTKVWRAKGKTRNFAMIYGENAASAAEKEGISVEEMQRGFDEYFRELGRLKQHRDFVIKFARNAFYVLTYFGRPVDVTQFYTSTVPYIQDKGDRFAYNAICQGTAADIAKIGMYRVCKNVLDVIDPDWIKVQLNNQIHDALMFIIKKSVDLPKFVAAIKEAMVFKIGPSPDPIVQKLHYGAANGWKTTPKVDIQVGKTYGQLIDYKGQSFEQVVEEIVSKRVLKEQPEEERKEDIKVELSRMLTSADALAFKALIVNNPGRNIVHLHMPDKTVQHIDKWPTSLTLKDAGRFEMIVPCKVSYEKPELEIDRIVKAMKQ